MYYVFISYYTNKQISCHDLHALVDISGMFKTRYIHMAPLKVKNSDDMTLLTVVFEARELMRCGFLSVLEAWRSNVGSSVRTPGKPELHVLIR